MTSRSFSFGKRLSSAFPDLAGSFHAYRYARQMRRVPLRDSPLGFRLLGNELMQKGAFEPLETNLLRTLASRIDVFVDVGANIGYYVCLMRSLGKRVVAFEPLRMNILFLLQNITANNWADGVEVFPIALSDRPQTVELFGGGTGASLVEDWAGASRTLREVVPANSLDNLLDGRFAGSRLLIKVDVEGAELGVLQGAAATLERAPSPTWLVEICLTENHPNGFNPNYAAVFGKFWDAGYECRSIDAGMKRVHRADVSRWVERKTRDFGYVSFLFEKTCE